MSSRKWYITKLGELRFNKLEAVKILRNNLRNFSYEYPLSEVLEIVNKLLSGEHDEPIDDFVKASFDIVFEGNEYEEVRDDEDELLYSPCEKEPDVWTKFTDQMPEPNAIIETGLDDEKNLIWTYRSFVLCMPF